MNPIVWFFLTLFFCPLVQAVPTSATLSVATSSLNAAPANFSDAQVKQIHKIIHDYLVQNPQVLIEASQAYQEQEFAKAKTKTQQAIVKNANALFNSPSSPTVGNHNGDVTVIEFLDYQCTHCREMSNLLNDLIKGDGKLRIVIKQLPIFGGASKFAAQATIAAIKQDPAKLLAFHKNLLETAAPLTNEKVLAAAKAAGINLGQLQNDMKNKFVDEQINDNFKLAQQLSLLGTPAFIIGNRSGSHIEYLPGAISLDNLKKTISQIRK